MDLMNSPDAFRENAMSHLGGLCYVHRFCMATVTSTSGWNNTPRAAFRSREDWSLKWWIMFALILSFVFHGLLFVSFDKISLVLGGNAQTVPSAKVPERIKIDPRLLQDQKAIQEIPEMIAPEGTKPDIQSFEANLDNFDKAQMIAENQEIDLTPNVKEVTNFLRDDPGDGRTAGSMASEMATLLAPQALDVPDLASAMASVRRDVLSKPMSEKQMLLDAGALDPGNGDSVDMKLLDEVKKGGVGSDAAGTRVKGFSNLDDLLGGGGTMGGSTAPILMPTDLLFDYGSDQLAEGARLSLMKLGFLIQKNPNSLFIVEGHTDSFGGEEFNLELSMRRANAVVEWLRASLRLGTDRIQAAGMGKSKPIVSTTGTVEEQGLNRRVEIKVRPKKN
jgi:outer membrane protein OmpA-like peptidoglycan-associated protein